MARSSASSDVSPDQINMVGEGTLFEGTLRAESNVRVSGYIKGKIDVEGRVIVTQEGVVEGELRATDADVAGSVQGEIYVTERLMLKSTARIDGNVEAGRVKVEEGALFAGHCTIGENVGETVQQQLEQKGPPRRAASPRRSSSEASEGGSAGKGQAGNAANRPGEKAEKEDEAKSTPGASEGGASGNGKTAPSATSKS